MRFWKRGQHGVHLYYYFWQVGAYFVVKRLHRVTNFEMIHHVTFAQYWIPSFLALLGVPFIWGPVGGGESAPRAFWRDFSMHGKVFEAFRTLARSLAAVDPVTLMVARRARIALATTQETAARLRRLGARHVIVHAEFGMTQWERESFGRFPLRRGNPFRLISIGRLLHWKGFHLALRAFARLVAVHPDCEYWIINEGPEMDHLKVLARKLGVQSKVTFWGKLPTLDDVYHKLSECDVLVHPALHEAFGNVCLEAMAAGRPVVCLDLGGPALQVTEEAGIKPAASSPQQAVRDLADAFCKLASDSELRARLSLGARKRVEQCFDWDRKGLSMAEVYQSVSNDQP
jgi:glycosyltransferase involved in cell wall biosynthesis